MRKLYLSIIICALMGLGGGLFAQNPKNTPPGLDPLLNPQVTNVVLQEATDYFQITLGQGYQSLLSGDLTIVATDKDGETQYDVEYGGGFICIIIKDEV